VRRGEPADACALASLDSLVNPSPWTENQFAGACGADPDAAECALLVGGEGQLQGFVVYSRVLDEACIHNIAVHPSQRGRGLGRLLLSAALAEAARGGAARCYLEVRASNTAAHRLYQGLGFQLDGVRRNYYSTAVGREDALLMSRQLTGQES
jgi:ribosomal-protein-alanine N-acetyltransferase